MTATLETLLERGEVECCYLLLRGDFTAHELDLIRRAFEDGVRIGRELEAMDAAKREHEDGHR